MTTKTISEQQLSAYFDGELSPAERAEVEQWLAREAEAEDAVAASAGPSGRAVLAELGLMRDALGASLNAEAARVPEARFEQIWDEIDRALDRDTAAHQPAAPSPSFWTRAFGLLRPVWVPVAATAGVAAVLLAVVKGGAVPTDTTGTNTAELVASKPEPLPAVAPTPAPAPALVAAAEVEPSFPEPDMREADIERIEFSGKQGRIGTIEGKRGTTTVIWVSDEEPGAGERSL
jgi:anti-sigma factor RsiW